MLELEAQPRGDLPRLLEQSRGAGLSEINHFAVVAEVLLRELRMPVDAESPDDQPLEVASEEIREIESPGLGVRQLGEGARAGEELITVGTRQPFHAFLAEQRIQPPAGAAIAVCNEDATVLAAVGADLLPHRGRDALRTVVQLGRQAADVDGRPATR